MSESQMRIVTFADDNFAKMVLGLFIEAHKDMILVGEAQNSVSAVQMVAECQPNILLMDLNLLAFDKIAAIQRIKHENPQTRVILLSTESVRTKLKAALAAEIDVYLPQLTLSTQLAMTMRQLCPL